MNRTSLNVIIYVNVDEFINGVGEYVDVKFICKFFNHSYAELGLVEPLG